MYFYSLYNEDENIIIMHEDKFTKDEYIKMCRETPMSGYDNLKYYNIYDVLLCLKKRYGFQDLDVTELYTGDLLENNKKLNIKTH